MDGYRLKPISTAETLIFSLKNIRFTWSDPEGNLGPTPKGRIGRRIRRDQNDQTSGMIRMATNEVTTVMGMPARR
jgi:hypothetical protein